MLARQTIRTTARALGAASRGSRRCVAELRPATSSYSTAAEAYDSPSREANAPRAYPLKMPQPARQAEPENHIAPEPQTSESKATTTTVEPKKRRTLRPLRPRKAAIKLSESAVTELRKMLDMPEPKLIKVGVKQKGCSGLTYDLEYVDQPGKLDEVVEQDGVKIVVDNKALMSVIGSEMHWEEDLLSQKFVFRNPNISEFPLVIWRRSTRGRGVYDGLLTSLQSKHAGAESRSWFKAENWERGLEGAASGEARGDPRKHQLLCIARSAHLPSDMYITGTADAFMRRYGS